MYEFQAQEKWNLCWQKFSCMSSARHKNSISFNILCFFLLLLWLFDWYWYFNIGTFLCFFSFICYFFLRLLLIYLFILCSLCFTGFNSNFTQIWLNIWLCFDFSFILLSIRLVRLLCWALLSICLILLCLRLIFINILLIWFWFLNISCFWFSIWFIFNLLFSFRFNCIHFFLA